MGQMTAMEWLISELRLREFEEMETKKGHPHLTDILESALAREAEQRDADYQRGLQDCSEDDSEPRGTEDDLPSNF
jgi:hypothetical protein